MNSMFESDWWYLFHKQVKNRDSTTWLRNWQFLTPAQKRYLQMHLLAERFFLVDNDGFSESGSQGLSKGSNAVF